MKNTFFKNIKVKILIVIFVLIISAIPAASYGYHLFHQGKILPGVKIGEMDVSGLTPAEARKILSNYQNKILEDGLQFVFEDNHISINPIVTGIEDPDASYWLFDFDIDRTISNAYNFGRENNLFFDAYNQLRLGVSPVVIPLEVSIFESELLNALETNFSDFEKPALSAELVYDDGFEITSEVPGLAFDYKGILTQIKNDLTNVRYATTTLQLAYDEPIVKKSQTDEVLKLAASIAQSDLPKLIYKNRSWELPSEASTTWLNLQAFEGQVTLTLDEEKVTKFLENIAKSINTEMQNATFVLSDSGKVTSFKPHRDGQELNFKKTYDLITTSVLNSKTDDIELPVAVVEANIKTADVNDLGIVELLGEGRSDFSGSPVNRRHNISVGVAALNGVLIKPDEEFSLINALGDIDAANGYRQELVIKGGKTIPEYGGGLCQIGTTTFRTALDAGLNITQRRNHSYRVSYYEPAGTDATIYDPWPDFRFINDTGKNILFKAEVNPNNQDELIFQFWGTSDGRVATRTAPIIYNITPPPPTKWIETTDLDPGETKCTELAHNGADTVFTQTITYSNGETKKIDYKSHYVPWQQVCLRGVEELSSATEKSDEVASEEAVDSLN
ncbi:MAG: hypothetical protein COT81_03150 [Candidatus Buchananbacteria bacterium CG10_big_fil_rev_8_21_14_0_10_42_9]|uniref:YoaR-like putative peptidoglycan binding domain-containing protein n=1 Tax=Candidatus Buchananbacteria bacterium CG10_big_fil_rev_8_21_14_0_10_42_9 TaxID=1974526 RepID=A0A2H0W157_9BACT|nr:MAG: hypothetical protein COT81_03150 [Candidatus Buchananbacteria bacterium CG10_big_fil_rev_8_21_14_0_10_42_9]